MLKKVKMFAVATVGMLTLASCAASAVSPVRGTIYSNVKAPLAVTGNSGSSKVGTGSATSILGAIATGDASVQAAAKSAGITKIHHVDYESTGILGIIATYKVFVYGE